MWRNCNASGRGARPVFANDTVDALIKAGHPPEWVLEKDQEHGFYDPALRKAFYEKLEAFLTKHIGK